jgi:hypothetical protein
VRKENKRSTSDVFEVLRFVDGFINDRAQAIADIDKLLSEGGGLHREGDNRLLFAGAFRNLADDKAADIFAGILRRVFNAAAPAKLHLRRLPQADGEIEIMAGNNRPFGVINIGDASGFLKLCKERDSKMVKDAAAFAASHFSEIGRADSPITMLVGAKKFTEGWNSWRVSTMGLMNVGRGQGPEIIQLFGRGVRLKGWQKSLMRQAAAPNAPPQSNAIPPLETLNIFGLRADFMERFREYLKKEGAPLNREEIVLPAFPTPPDIHKLNLKTIRADGKTEENFQREESASLAANGGSVTLDWRARVQMEASDDHSGGGGGKSEAITIPPEAIALTDFEQIYRELQHHKAGRPNLTISRHAVRELLHKNDWYTLYCPPDAVAPHSMGNIRRCEEIIVALLKKRANQRYTSARNKWESGARRYVNLTADDDNFIAEYRVTVNDDKGLAKNLVEFAGKLEKIRDTIKAGGKPSFSLLSIPPPKLRAVMFCRHLYQPLLYLSEGGGVEVAPQSVTLNEGEKKFICDLHLHLENRKNAAAFADKTLFLLRNRTKGRGVTFFAEGDFSPDFIMWLVSGKTQDIAFVDPKGIHHLHGPENPKLRFYQTIKEEEKRLAAKGCAAGEVIRLHSFILSRTPFASLDWARQSKIDKAGLEARNCLFMESPDYLQKMFAKIAVSPKAG